MSAVPRERARWTPGLTTLAIETSCDDTSVAVLSIEQKPANNGHQHATSLSPVIRYHETLTANSKAYNGIHPLVAEQSHQFNVAGLVQSARTVLHKDGLKDKPDFISVTRGPGMRSSLSVGLNVAKGLAIAWGVSLVGVHHMQAHALTARLCCAMENPIHMRNDGESDIKPRFPYLSALVSGGHTMLLDSQSLVDHRILAETSDIALGDCLDKSARAVLPSDSLVPPYGKALEDFAFPRREADYAYIPPINREEELKSRRTHWGWSLAPPLSQNKGGGKTTRRMQYSFAGLLSSVERLMRHGTTQDGTINISARSAESVTSEERKDMAREVLRVAFEHLASRILLYLSSPPRKYVNTVVVGGGVASNRFLRHVLRAMLDARGYSHVDILFPPPKLCTDNALMIAWAGMEMYTAGYTTSLDIAPIRKWSMDPIADDGGILGVEGWAKIDNS